MPGFEGLLMIVKLAAIGFIAIRLASCAIGMVIYVILTPDQSKF